MESTTVWVVTIAAIALLFVFDFYVVVRNPHEPSFKESVRWTIFYVSLAALFGVSMFAWKSAQAGTEFFAGYITEWSLSVDNLFVFLVIFGAFAERSLRRAR